jgi:hypothetical protein
MPKRSHAAARTAHTKQKPRPRPISKAHLQELHESQAAADAVQRQMKSANRKRKKSLDGVK